MDNNRDSADSHPTEQFGPVPPGPVQPGSGGPGSGGSGGRPARGRPVIRWAAGAAAVAVLAGGAAALAAGSGSARPATTSQASALDAVLSSADSPTSADQAATSPTSAAASTAAAGAAAAGAAAPSHPCAKGAAALRAAGHPRLARRAAAVCRGRLGRLRLLLRGEHGQVTYRAKDGTSKTLAFERGKITAVSGTAVTVAAADGTTWTWHLVSDSVVRQDGQKVSASSLAAGQQVFAGGPVLNGTDDARLIVIRPAAAASSASPSTVPSGS
jgi:hypothetical protein